MRRRLTRPAALLRQAQLRAAVYTAIDEQERQRGVHLEDPRLARLRDNAPSRVAVDLVTDFLTFYNLDATLSCLLPEIGFVSPRAAQPLCTCCQACRGGTCDVMPLPP